MATPTLSRGRASGTIHGNWWPDRATWPTGPIGDELGRVVQAYDAWASAGRELRKLLREVDGVAIQDARDRGVAMAHGEPAPEPEADRMRARIVELEHELPALEVAYATRSNETLAIIETDGTWLESARAARDEAVVAYERTIQAMRDARQVVAEAAALVDWHERRQAGRLRNVAPAAEAHVFDGVLADLAKWTAPPPEPTVTVVDWGDDE